jgi:hypothetical protein
MLRRQLALPLFLVASLLSLPLAGRADETPTPLRVDIIRSGIPKAHSMPARPTPRELDDAATPIVDREGNAGVAKAKDSRFDPYRFVRDVAGPDVQQVVIGSHAGSAARAAQSDVVIEGRLIDSAAFLSQGGGSVYSQYTFRVDKITKPLGASLAVGDTLTAERLGGRVRYPDGKIVRYRVSGQGSPVQGKKYLLFLARSADGRYTLLTGFEIRGAQRLPLDREPAASGGVPRNLEKTAGCSTNPPKDPELNGWTANSTVSVYIDPSIQGDARAAVVQAFSNWGAASGPTGDNSGVSFTFVDSPAASNGFTVTYGTPPAGIRASTDMGHAGATVTDAETAIDPSVTNYDAMLESMAHEIGHTFGIDDCTACSLTDSVMAGRPNGTDFNSANGRPTSPTPCDKQAVKAGNYPASTGGGGGGLPPGSGDGGGSPFGCTPEYEWHEVSFDHGQTWYVESYDYLGCW